MFNLLTFYLTNSWISMQNFLLNKSVRAFIAKYYWHEFQCRISKFDEKLFTQRWYNKTSLFLNARKNYAQNGGSNSTPRILTLVELVALTQLHPHSLANLLTNHQHLLTFNIFPRWFKLGVYNSLFTVRAPL